MRFHKRPPENVVGDRTYVDYKDMDLLTKCVSPTGKLLPRRRLGTNAKTQHKIKKAVHRARFMAMIGYGG